MLYTEYGPGFGEEELSQDLLLPLSLNLPLFTVDSVIDQLHH